MGQWVSDTIKDWEVQLVVTTNGRIVNAIDTLDIKKRDKKCISHILKVYRNKIIMYPKTGLVLHINKSGGKLINTGFSPTSLPNLMVG